MDILRIEEKFFAEAIEKSLLRTESPDSNMKYLNLKLKKYLSWKVS